MKLSMLLLLLASCKVPFEPPGARPLVPTDSFPVWWRELEDCSGTTGDLSRIGWFEAPSQVNGMFYCGSIMALGCWVRPHTVYLVEGNIRNRWLIKHEMIHDLLQRGDHPVPPFNVCN